MKKLLLFVTMAASLLFTQCKKEESVSSAGKTVSMTVTAGPGSKTDITENGAITWSDGDQLYVGDGSKYVGYLTIASGVGTPTGVFTGSVTLPTDTKDGEKSFGFFYLGSGELTLEDDATSVDVDFSSQNIHKGKSDEDPLQNAGKCHVGYGSAKGTVTDGTVTDINVMLVSKVALAHFDIKKGEDPYGATLTLSGDNICNKMTVKFDGTGFSYEGTKGNISLDGGNGDYYVMLVPTEETMGPQTLTFADANVSGTATLDDGIKPNQFYGKDTPIAVTLTPTTIPVTSVTLSKTSLSLEAGKTETLVATVFPNDATNKDVTWSSDDESVATVSDAGVVTAVGAGSTTITVTAVDDDSKFATCTVTVTAPSYLPGEFTINSGGTKVKFSKGNLWYDGEKFHFEPNQWSFKDSWDENHVSHFLWSKDKDVAVSTSTSTPSGGIASDVFFTNATQTTANSTFHVDGEEAGTWRTLSVDEWVYLMLNRSVTNRFAKARVSGVDGLLIFPDEYSGTTSGTGIATVNTGNAAFPTSDIPSTTWTSMESAGVVFLPRAGYRRGNTVYNVAFYGYYLSSTPSGYDRMYHLYFSSSNVYCNNTSVWFDGSSVRLVR